jgi:hypothetical protein
MKKRDWLVVVFGIPALTLALLYNAGLSSIWELALSPFAAGVYLFFRGASLRSSFSALVLNAFLALPVGYFLMLFTWAYALCEPGMHDMCLR